MSPEPAQAERVRAIVRLHGRVQTVGFRDTVLAIAQRHAVHGHVRNLREGERLEIDVEGTPAEVDAFLADVLANPPRYARLEEVECVTAPPQGVTGFALASTL